MPNDNTHTGIDWWGAINMSGHGETESSAFTACFGKELEQSDFEAICEWAVQTFLSRTPAEPKAGCKGYMCNRGADGTNGPFHYGCDTCGRTLSSMNPCYSGEMCIHVPYAEPKAGDWDAALLDTLLYSQGHGIKTPPHEDPSDILDEYEKSIPDGAYRESIRSIRRALSSAAPRITKRKWISVDERLPEYHKLVQVHGGLAWLDDDGEWYSATSAPNLMLADCIALGSIRIRWEVTHWMPYTPPPFTPTQTEE